MSPDSLSRTRSVHYLGPMWTLRKNFERYAWSWKKLFAFPVGKTLTELKQFGCARSDAKVWIGAGECLEALPFSWLISAWERICDGEKVRVENVYIGASSLGLYQCFV